MPSVFGVAGVGDAFVFTDDHPPPHIHFRHQGEGWTIRCRFSFLTDISGLYGGIRLVRRRPGAATVNSILGHVEREIAACRATWWAVHATTGLEGRWAEISPTGIVRIPLKKPARGALRVIGARYAPQAPRGATVTLTFDDGTTRTVVAGQGIELAEEWS